MPSCSKKCHTAKWLTLIPRDVGLLRQPSQKPITLARQWIWPAATNLVSRGASGRPEPLRPLHNARDADLELGRDRTTALPGRNRRNHTLAQIKRIGSGHQMLASIPANTLNHIRPRNPSDSEKISHALDRPLLHTRLPSVQSALGSCQSCDRLSCACRSVWPEKVSLSDPVSLCHNQL
jgi:hypothetical protein